MTGTLGRLTTGVYTVPTAQPETDGTAAWDATTVVTVTAEADGETGLGWSYTDPRAAGVVDGVLAPLVAGRDPDDLPELRHRMLAATRNMGATGVVASAISAVDIALWDLKARRHGLSIAQLVGRAHPSVPVYGSGGFTDYTDEHTAAELRGWLELGIRNVKIKIGASWGAHPVRDLERIALARRVVGDDVGLFVDANGGYSVGEAIRAERAFRDLGVIWFEEPVSSDYPHTMADVRRAALADVAAGEYVWRLADAAALVTAGAVDCLQLDVTRCGGYSGWLEAAAYAGGHGLQVSGHCGQHLTAHIAAATPNARHLEYFIDHLRVDTALFDGLLPVEDGRLAPDPAVPGHGMRLAASAARFRQEDPR
ncbi:MAG: enolase C-terminal domain-like protein [Amnibacterium sp.]